MASWQGEHLWINQLAEGVAVLMLDMQDRPVNVLSRAVLAEVWCVCLRPVRFGEGARLGSGVAHQPSPVEQDHDVDGRE